MEGRGERRAERAGGTCIDKAAYLGMHAPRCQGQESVMRCCPGPSLNDECRRPPNVNLTGQVVPYLLEAGWFVYLEVEHICGCLPPGKQVGTQDGEVGEVAAPHNPLHQQHEQWEGCNKGKYKART